MPFSERIQEIKFFETTKRNEPQPDKEIQKIQKAGMEPQHYLHCSAIDYATGNGLVKVIVIN